MNKFSRDTESKNSFLDLYKKYLSASSDGSKFLRIKISNEVNYIIARYLKKYIYILIMKTYINDAKLQLIQRDETGPVFLTSG